MREPRPLIPVVPLAFILPDPLFQPQQRASDADRDTAVDILCAAVAEGRLTLTELDERVGAALCARTICGLAARNDRSSVKWSQYSRKAWFSLRSSIFCRHFRRAASNSAFSKGLVM